MKKPKILIVDDDPAGVEALTAALEAIGCRCQSAASVPEGLLQLGRTRFDLVTTCMLLPGVDGLELIRVLNHNRDEMLLAVPVVVVTSCAKPEYRDKALALGARDYILKPYRTDDLQARIRRLLEEQGFHF